MLIDKKNFCEICGSSNFKFLYAKDHQIDGVDSFLYGECQSCGCLQCLNVPLDLSIYYPQDYYSHKLPQKASWWKRIRRSLKRNFVLTHPGYISKWVMWWLRDYSIFWTYRRAKLRKENSLLDVGTGSGSHVLHLRESGFKKALGVDPFIPADVYIDQEILVKKTDFLNIREKFDVITFHHSLEHMRDPLLTLSHARKLLNENGWILIRIPTVSSDAYEIYKDNWCALDAPRHIFLHSHKSIKILAEKSGLYMHDIWCDSEIGQFIHSEEYKAGIKLSDPKSYKNSPKNSIFSKVDVIKFLKKTKEVNEKLRGDFVCVILKSI